MLVTFMATTAIAMLLMSKALAAPAGFAGNTCPTQDQMNQLKGLIGSKLPSGTITNSDLQKLLEQYGGSKASCSLNELINSAFSKLPAKPCTPKATATPAPTKTPAATAAPTATPAPTATAAPSATKAPTATAAPTATPAPTATANSGMSAAEQKMINLVNQDRADNGLKPLVYDATLRVPALKHSQDMSQSNYFSHTSPNYGTFSQRLKASGVKYSSAGENIAMYNSVEAAQVGFMNSAGHRANILGDYTRVGIGIVYNQNKGVYYITQWFAK